jgi:hypothetical protein
VTFARIATVVTVTLLVGLAGCGHDPKPTTAAAVTDVPLEAGTGAPAGTESAVPKANAPKVNAPKAAVPTAKKPARKAPAAARPDADAGSGGAGPDRFVAAVQRKLPDVALDRRDEEVEDLGEQACSALKRGRSVTVAAGEVAEQGVAPADARTLVGLAKDDLCRA